MRKTLLQIVQDILDQLDSEEVNTISETVESDQIASICGVVFYEIINERDIPEHRELIKLTAASDNTTPTRFSYPDNVEEVKAVWYTRSDGEVYEVCWKDPLDFIVDADKLNSNYVSVPEGEVNLRVANDADPTYYTSFDDENIIMNSYDSDVDTTLQESKVRAFGTRVPTFTKLDSYIPDLDANLFPLYVAECTSRCMSLFKGAADPKVEQASRRQRTHFVKKKHRAKQANNWSNYGRS